MDLSPGTVNRPENESVRDDLTAASGEESRDFGEGFTIEKCLTGAFTMARQADPC